MKLPYEFVTSYYSGPQEERDGDQHTMQDMSLQEGSTLRVYFLGLESPIINRPLSAREKSLTIHFPSNPTGNSASNIGISGEDTTPTISENRNLEMPYVKPGDIQQETNTLGSLHVSPAGHMSRVTSIMTFENKVLQSGDYSSCTPISNLLRGRSAKGPPYEATVEKLVQQAQYVTESDITSRARYFILFLTMLIIFLEYFCVNGMSSLDTFRPLTAVELYLSCACANTDDSASNPLPSTSPSLEKEHIDEEIEAEFSKLAYQSWRGDDMEIPPSEGKQYVVSLNVNGQVLVDYTKAGTSLWSKLH